MIEFVRTDRLIGAILDCTHSLLVTIRSGPETVRVDLIRSEN
jgi:hypothetical protein